MGAVVLSVDRNNKKISLSIRAHQDGAERKDMESYVSLLRSARGDNRFWGSSPGQAEYRRGLNPGVG